MFQKLQKFKKQEFSIFNVHNYVRWAGINFIICIKYMPILILDNFIDNP